MTTVGAILLAGGSGSRLGGVDKAALAISGATLLERALDALQGLDVVVVGPPRDLPGVTVVREDPPLGGPAAAALAGLAALPPCGDEVLLLAVDVPRLPEAVAILLATGGGPDGVIAVDDEGRDQWLLGRYRIAAVQEVAKSLGETNGRPAKALLGGLDLRRLHLPPGLAEDVDTVADARRAGVVLPGEERP